MKIAKLIILSVCFLLVATCSYAQDVQQFVHLLTKAEATGQGVSIGCDCYQNVEWKQGSATMNGLPIFARNSARPIVNPRQTEVYNLYERSALGGSVLRERHTVVVIDLSIQIKEGNYPKVMAKRQLTFVGDMLNAGEANLYNLNTPTSIIKNWVLNAKTPVPPYAVSKTEQYNLMNESTHVEKMVMTKNDNSNENQVDTWAFTYTINLKGWNCSRQPTYRAVTSPIHYVDVHKLLITKFRDQASKKDWKVVVGQDIEKEAVSSPDCSNFGWEMPDIKSTLSDKVWHLQNSGINNLKIPFSDLSGDGITPRIKNADFGDKFGCVKVFCRDNYGSGTWFTTTSRNAAGNPDYVMKPPKAVKVFFPKNMDLSGNFTSNKDAYDNMLSTTPTLSTNKPLWFIFWKEGRVVEALHDVLYDNNADYGVTTNPPNQVFVGRIAVDKNTGPEYIPEIITKNIKTVTGDGTHAQCLIETIVHENYHKIVNSTNGWQNNAASSITLPGVTPDSDGIPEAEEDVPGSWGDRTYPSGAFFIRTKKDNPDTYNYLYGTDPITGIRFVAGYEDNELRCRHLERNLNYSPTSKVYRSNIDWSVNIYNQGNW